MRWFFIFIPAICFGEIIKCPDGVWREGDCSRKSEARTKVSPDLAERRRVFTDLDLEAFRARRDGRGDVDISKAREDCLGEKATLDTCRNTVDSIYEKLKPLPTPVVQVVDQSIESTKVIVINEENNYIRPTKASPTPYSRPTELPINSRSLSGKVSN